MSDENKNDKDTNEPTKKSLGWAQWAFPGVDPAAALYEAFQGPSVKYKDVIDLAPGDIIRVGHVAVFVVGVRLQEFENPDQGTCSYTVIVAGAPADWKGSDWHWRSRGVLYDSPFLAFNAEDEVILERPSPTPTSSLDKLIELRQKIRDKRAKAEEEARKASKSMRAWVDKTAKEGKNAYSPGEWGSEKESTQAEASSEKADDPEHGSE